MSKILVIHGWGHSIHVYDKLKKDLECLGHSVDVLPLSGFDKSTNYVQKYWWYTAEVRKALAKEYDLVVAHSMGASVVLYTLMKKEYRSKFLLISPVYPCMPSIKKLVPYRKAIISLLKCLQEDSPFNRFLIKLLASSTVNGYRNVTDEIVKSVQSMNPYTACDTLLSMADNVYDEPADTLNDITVMYGSKDKVVRAESLLLLCEDYIIDDIKVLKGVGHTPVIEAYDSFMRYIVNML